MEKSRIWTKEEETVIYNNISLYPNNLVYAFECAAKFLNKRTVKAISLRYYISLKKRKQVISVLSSKGLSTLNNQKNAPRRKDSSEEEYIIIIQKLLRKISRKSQIELVESILQI